MELKIGDLAKKVGVNIQTLRYYESRGLLIPTSRMDSGYRLYDAEAKKRLEFILYAKGLGFTLKETEELLRLRVSRSAKCGDIKQKAKDKVQEIDKKIKGLQSINNVLKKLIEACQTGQSTEHCPILKTIDKKRTKN